MIAAFWRISPSFGKNPPEYSVRKPSPCYLFDLAFQIIESQVMQPIQRKRGLLLGGPPGRMDSFEDENEQFQVVANCEQNQS